MSFTPPMGLGFTASSDEGTFGPPPGLPIPSSRHSRLPRRVRRAIALVLVVAVLAAVVLLFALTPS